MDCLLSLYAIKLPDDGNKSLQNGYTNTNFFMDIINWP